MTFLDIAFETSIYTFLVIFLVGIGLSIWFSKWFFGEKDPLSHFPHTNIPSSKAVHEMNKLLSSIKPYSDEVPPDKRVQIRQDIEFLQKYQETLIQRIHNEQKRYQQITKKREVLWHQLNDLINAMSLFQRIRGKHKNWNYQEALHNYQNTELLVEEELRHLKVMDDIHFDEVRNYSIFQQYAWLIYPNQKPPALEDPPTTEEPSKTEETINSNESSEEKSEDQSSNTTIPDSEIAFPQDENSSPNNQPSSSDENIQSEVAKPRASNEIYQSDFPILNLNASGKTYKDATFQLNFEPQRLLQHYQFNHCVFDNVHFHGVHQYEFCEFQHTDFTGSRWLREAQPHRFNHCNFQNALLNRTGWVYTAFYHCNFNQSIWKNCLFKKVKFVQCSFDGVDFSTLDFSQTVVSKDMLESNDFSKCIAPPQNFLNVSSDTDEDVVSESFTPEENLPPFSPTSSSEKETDLETPLNTSP